MAVGGSYRVLIGDLLNVSKIELGQLPFQDEMFDVNEVVKETVEQMQLTTTKQTIRIEGRITQSVCGDKDRIGQVLTNLLSNAMKYSPGTDTVLVRLTAEQDVAVVTVQDFGIGIAKEHHAHIFERFYQVTDPQENTYPGLGIGLYISHEIITRHGGHIWVQSTKGQGATFYVSLPLKNEGA
jgi:signal transduction histidine kinase